MADDFKPGVGGSYQINEDGSVDLIERTEQQAPAPAPAPVVDEQP